MVLFHCTFVALKARNRLTVQIRPDEFILSREKRLFQAYVSFALHHDIRQPNQQTWTAHAMSD